MKKKKSILFLSAIATGVAIFFGRKRRSKAGTEEGEWTSEAGNPVGSPDSDSASDATESDMPAESDDEATAEAAAADADAASDADAAAGDEEAKTS